MVKDKPVYPIKVLYKLLSILDTILQHGSPMNMTKISEKLGLYPSKYHSSHIRYSKTLGLCRTGPQHTKIPARPEVIRIRYG